MSIPDNVSGKMEYIQNVFLAVQNYMQSHHDLNDLIDFLDAEPAEFRSVAYESASMGVGHKDLTIGSPMSDWVRFYNRSREVHSFHMEIGLGWAFAKAEISPESYWQSLGPLMHSMVYDGMGYFHGLFKRRRTVKDHLVPESVTMENLHGFDQGIGRRLWYDCKGTLDSLVQLIESFPLARRSDLWRGVGIACGYVGGNQMSDLALLSKASAEYRQHVCAGIAFAAISRKASDSVTDSLEAACQIICGMQIQDVLRVRADIMKKSDSSKETIDLKQIRQLEAQFARSQ